MPFTDQAVLDHIAAHPGAGREHVRRHVAPEVSAPTVWRVLKRLVDEGRLEVSGSARATGYSLAGAAVVRAHLQTPYNRWRPAVYRKEFVDRYVPNKSFYLGEADRRRLLEAGRPVPPPLPLCRRSQHAPPDTVDQASCADRTHKNTIPRRKIPASENHTDYLLTPNLQKSRATIYYLVII